MLNFVSKPKPPAAPSAIHQRTSPVRRSRASEKRAEGPPELIEDHRLEEIRPGAGRADAPPPRAPPSTWAKRPPPNSRAIAPASRIVPARRDRRDEADREQRVAEEEALDAREDGDHRREVHPEEPEMLSHREVEEFVAMHAVRAREIHHDVRDEHDRGDRPRPAASGTGGRGSGTRPGSSCGLHHTREAGAQFLERGEQRELRAAALQVVVRAGRRGSSGRLRDGR